MKTGLEKIEHGFCAEGSKVVSLKHFPKFIHID